MSYKALTPENVKDFPNFKYSEFKCHCGGKYCNGYPVPFSYDLASNLQNIRTHFGKPLKITSPLRCETWNSKQGGVKNSKHKKGWACDFYISGVSYDTLASYVKTLPYFHYCYRIKKNQNVIHYDITPPNESNVVQPVERDTSKDQFKVLAKSLRVRDNHNTSSNIVGYAQTNGIYNWLEMIKDGKYDWYRIADNQWVANNGKYLEIYKKEDGEQEMIDELQKQIQELTDKNNVLEAKCVDLEKEKQELIDNTNSYKSLYKCLKSGKYKINIDLKKDEELYIKERE